jgi:hypothetical protein
VHARDERIARATAIAEPDQRALGAAHDPATQTVDAGRIISAHIVTFPTVAKAVASLLDARLLKSMTIR